MIYHAEYYQGRTLMGARSLGIQKTKRQGGLAALPHCSICARLQRLHIRGAGKLWVAAIHSIVNPCPVFQIREMRRMSSKDAAAFSVFPDEAHVIEADKSPRRPLWHLNHPLSWLVCHSGLYSKYQIETITGITMGRFMVRWRRKRATASAKSSRATSRSAARGLRIEVSTDLRMMRRV